MIMYITELIFIKLKIILAQPGVSSCIAHLLIFPNSSIFNLIFIAANNPKNINNNVMAKIINNFIFINSKAYPVKLSKLELILHAIYILKILCYNIPSDIISPNVKINPSYQKTKIFQQKKNKYYSF